MPFLRPGPCRCDRFRSGGCLIGCFLLYLSSGRQLLSGIVRSARRHPPGSSRSRISYRSCNCVANNNFIHMRSILRSLVAAACLSFPGLAAAQSLPGADSSAVVAYRPQFSTAGFYELPGTGRTVYNMNPAWRFHRGAAEGAGQRDFDDRTWPLVSLPDGPEGRTLVTHVENLDTETCFSIVRNRLYTMGEKSQSQSYGEDVPVDLSAAGVLVLNANHQWQIQNSIIFN